MKQAAAVLLGAVSFCAGCASAPPAPSPVRPTPSRPTATPSATPSPQPTTPPMPSRVPTVPPPAAMPTGEVDPPLVRVLLERSSDPVVIPQPGRAYRVTTDSGVSWLWGPLEVSVGAIGPRWWQVGAYSDSTGVSAATAEISRALGPDVRILQQKTAVGLTRLRVG